ncbi:inositol monophosphatase family protein [Rhodovarius crocodyli]|uniref:inositol monophosphatase family protein n=1 Tax=Rhodovarius crocodyli TaxID=1979269 RepID=UPI0013E3F2BA|nr:inositol monophosphatase family protein [Rhodovarius crocodyli]
MKIDTIPENEYLFDTAKKAVKITKDFIKMKRGTDRSPVSQLGRDIKLSEDAASEAMIREFLAQHSDLPVLGEEGGWEGREPQPDDLHWVLDPLDGSFNYFRGVPLYGISLALCRGRTAVFGAIYDPERDELFSGGPGLGLQLNEEFITQPAPTRQMLATGFPSRADVNVTLERMGELTARWTKMRMLGAAALSLAWVAAGRLDGYTENGIMWWDVAAGLALAQGAGATTILCQPVSEYGVNVLVER